MVRCGPRPAGATSCNDPVILFEVVSPGSEARDRLEKRIAYQALPSLQTFVLVERDRMMVDVYQRGNGVVTDAKQLTRPDDRVALPSIGFELALAEIYRDVLPRPAA